MEYYRIGTRNCKEREGRWQRPICLSISRWTWPTKVLWQQDHRCMHPPRQSGIINLEAHRSDGLLRRVTASLLPKPKLNGSPQANNQNPYTKPNRNMGLCKVLFHREISVYNVSKYLSMHLTAERLLCMMSL